MKTIYYLGHFVIGERLFDFPTLNRPLRGVICLGVKTSRRERPFIYKCVPLHVHFDANKTHFHTKGLICRRTRFETEAQNCFLRYQMVLVNGLNHSVRNYITINITKANSVVLTLFYLSHTDKSKRHQKIAPINKNNSNKIHSDAVDST